MGSENVYKTSEIFEGQANLYNQIYGFMRPMSIKWAVELGIPDIIHKHGKPITLIELVSTLQIPEIKSNCVHSVMRLLAHNKIFAIVKIDDNTEAYALTPTSKLLVKSTDHCLSPMVQLVTEPTSVGLYYQLGKWTHTDDPSIFGTSIWDLMRKTSTFSKSYNKAMESDSNVVRFAMNDCKFVFEGLTSLVDVGGGTGNTAKIICETFPKLKYIVLDVPDVISGLTGNNYLSFVGGNMFESIPEADAILLKWILHDWNDDDCVKILKKCKEVISKKNKTGKVIIIDIVINEEQDEHEMTELKLFNDIAMMASCNSRERDEKAWKKIIKDSGFSNYKIFPIFGFRSLIELYV